MAVASGTASGSLSLAVGNTSLSVRVTAADGINTQTYSITVTRLPEVLVFNSATDVPVTAGGFVAPGIPVSLALNFAPSPGTRLTVVNNTGMERMQGAFANLVQGQRVDLTYAGISYAFVADYFCGTGNDLVLQWANTRLLAWGNNNSGQLGDDSVVSRSAPVPVDMTGVLAGKTVTAVATAGDYSLALCSDGTLAAWGSNYYGYLGNNSSTNSSTPVLVDRSGVLAGKTVIAIAAGEDHNLVLCSDGSMATWGSNGDSPLGTSSAPGYNSAVPAGRSLPSLAVDRIIWPCVRMVPSSLGATTGVANWAITKPPIAGPQCWWIAAACSRADKLSLLPPGPHTAWPCARMVRLPPGAVTAAVQWATIA